MHDPATGDAFDDAIVLWFPAPRSFTGEDVAEIQFHGSRAGGRLLIATLQAMAGLRLARPGEFARRVMALQERHQKGRGYEPASVWRRSAISV